VCVCVCVWCVVCVCVCVWGVRGVCVMWVCVCDVGVCVVCVCRFLSAVINVQAKRVNHFWLQGLDTVRCVQRHEVVFMSAFRRKLV